MAAVATIARPTRPSGFARAERPVAGRTVRPSAATFRRRRIVVAILVMAGIVGTARAAVALGGPTLAAPEQPPAVVATYVVEPGDSLWVVAGELAPGRDPRPVVDALIAARGDAPLIPGERITWGGSSP